MRKLVGASEMESVGVDGFIIRSLSWNNRSVTVVAANQPKGALYGVFHFLRLIQTQQPLDNLSIQQKPQTFLDRFFPNSRPAKGARNRLRIFQQEISKYVEHLKVKMTIKVKCIDKNPRAIEYRKALAAQKI